MNRIMQNNDLATTGPAAQQPLPAKNLGGRGAPPRVTRRRGSFLFMVALTLISLNSCTVAWAEEKSWNGEGDQSGWFDDANWLPAGAPTASDDTMTDFKDANIDVPQSFEVHSLTIGGKRNSTVSVSNFADATLAPANVTDDAVVNRRDGKLILKGSNGKIHLKGAYKDSEEVIPEEPSFMLYVK